jgi:hypothetical protein
MSLVVSELFIVVHVFPQAILMQPNRIGVPPDELIHIQTVNRRRAPDLLLLAIHEYGHELLPSLLASALLFFSQFPLRLSHL